MTLYGSGSAAVHSPEAIDWEALPNSFVIQIHWPPTTAFLSLLQQHHFQTITLARHPLDVLLSILHFSSFDQSTASWLLGEDGNEDTIFAAMPCSARFRAYAIGRRAAALLALTTLWWAQPDCLPLRYEDLIEEPARALQRVVECVAQPTARALEQIVAANTLTKLREQHFYARHHYWRGRPGHWRELMPKEVAGPIADAHATVFALFGYRCDADPALTMPQADATWVRLVREEMAALQRRLVFLEESTRTLQAELAAGQGQVMECRVASLCRETELASLRAELSAVLARLVAEQQKCLDMRAARAGARRQLAPLDGLHPLPLRLARKAQCLAHCFSRLSGLLKSIIRGNV